MKKVHALQINHNPELRRHSAQQASDNSQNTKCRFCKQNISNKMFSASPCQCLDSIHTQCIPHEMEAVLLGQFISSHTVRRYSCRRCKGTIRFQTKDNLQCRSCQQIGKFGRNNQGVCMWLIIGVTFMFLLLVFLVVLAVKPEIIKSGPVSYNAVLIGTAIAFATVTILVVFFLFTSLLCMRISKVTILPNGRDRKMSSMLEISQLS